MKSKYYQEGNRGSDRAKQWISIEAELNQWESFEKSEDRGNDMKEEINERIVYFFERMETNT
jgi:hypothetical protein